MNSLTEVLVAFGLFVLTFGTILSPLQLNRRSAVECDQRMRALALATDLIEQQRCLAFDQVKGLQGRREPYAYTLQVRQQPHLKILSLQVRWGQNGVLDYGTYLQGEEP